MGEAEVEKIAEEPAAKRARMSSMSMNIDAILLSSSENKSFLELTKEPVSVLIGMATWTDDVAEKLHVRTVGGLGKWKFFLWARAFVTLAVREVEAHRGEQSRLNVDQALEHQHAGKSFKDILKLPPSALLGLEADDLLLSFHIKSIQDLGNWKYGHIANAIVTLADLEHQMSS